MGDKDPKHVSGPIMASQSSSVMMSMQGNKMIHIQNMSSTAIFVLQQVLETKAAVIFMEINVSDYIQIHCVRRRESLMMPAPAIIKMSHYISPPVVESPVH